MWLLAVAEAQPDDGTDDVQRLRKPPQAGRRTHPYARRVRGLQGATAGEAESSLSAKAALGDLYTEADHLQAVAPPASFFA